MESFPFGVSPAGARELLDEGGTGVEVEVGAESRVEVGNAKTEGLGVEGASVLIVAEPMYCRLRIVERLVGKMPLFANYSRLNEAD